MFLAWVPPVRTFSPALGGYLNYYVQISMASTTTPLFQVYCKILPTSCAVSLETIALTRYKLASKPLVTPPLVITLSPPRRIDCRLVMDSRRFCDSFHALLPFLASARLPFLVM